MTPEPAEDYQIIELSVAHAKQLHALVNQTWWGERRTLSQVESMIANTSLILGLIETHSERLIGSCRVLTDFTFRATVYDVMVDQQHQGQGHGRRILDALSQHPRLQDVSSISLSCEPHMVEFYQQWGFQVHEGRTLWLTKTQHEECS